MSDILIWAGIAIAFLIAFLLFITSVYRKVSQGYALIVNNISNKPKVSFTGSVVIPVFHKAEIMKISLITLEIDRRAKDGLICKDNLRADITVAFYLRVNETRDDVLKVAKSIGVDRASDKDAVNELFNAKFSEALKTVGKQMDFLELFENRIQFRENIVQVIGDDLNGYILEDVAIDYLEQTPKAQLDPNNILDSEGIRKITEITAEQNIQTNRFEKDEELAITKKNVETKESMLELQRQEADAEARQQREVATIQAREEAETLKIQSEEREKSEEARISADEKIAIREENKLRQVEVAEKNRERAVIIEEEKVIKAKELEAVNREREVELERISKEKALEEERKLIANTISERIAVEKKVAEEEERIKEVKEIQEAERSKQVKILEAEAKANEELIYSVKRAEAEEESAKFRAKEINMMAQAELEAAAKQAEAAKKLAEGKQAEIAADGLAEAKIIEAKADAMEKEGLAKARVMEAEAEANEKQGFAEAKVLEEKLQAEAKGNEQIGLAEAKANREKGIADAAVIEQKGMAEASIIKQKASSEAQGLIEKFEAMNNMSVEAREFEEFKMNLDAHLKEIMAKIDANKSVAKDQAEVISTALENSNIDIVGGQGDYFDKLAKGMGMGNAVDGFLDKSPVVQAMLEKFLGGAPTKKETDNDA
ncbi:flotillin family protein [Pleionea sp. CnH1-48]|uniref:flotillin family protein n=1 Tax=Pleionea sp. CnH1-48 TaxID=2954494 RepID=UPI0020981201|nr:hypothetical protein [Pleionea sp. CnH1-48]MCO7225188.1 hypothetical protein [Pleionea sp. CnH1-48]